MRCTHLNDLKEVFMIDGQGLCSLSCFNMHLKLPLYLPIVGHRQKYNIRARAALIHSAPVCQPCSVIGSREGKV